MPGMDGLEVLAHLRDKVPETKIVVLSSSESARMAPIVMELGATHFIDKCVGATELRQVIRDVCVCAPSGQTQ